MTEVNSQISELATELEKFVESNNDASNILDILKKLDTYEVTTESLKTKSLGKTVNKLRKHTDSEVSAASDKLITKWKEAVDKKKSSQNSQDAQPDEATDKKRKQDETASPKKSKKEKKEKKEKKHKKEKKNKKKKSDDEEEVQPVQTKKIKITMSSASPANSPKPKSKSDATNDPTRKKVIDMLTEKLLTKQEEDSYEATDIALSIELELFKKNNQIVDANYKSKMLSISFNLGKNPDLCASVMKGVIIPSKLVNMTPQEMASDDIKEQRRKIEQNNLDACQMAKPSQIETDMFKCGKCGSRKTAYFQLQTRSADEPMTTFHNCNACGHRWRS